MNSIFKKLSLIFLALIVLISVSSISAADTDLQLDVIDSANDSSLDISSDSSNCISSDEDLNLEISSKNNLNSIFDNEKDSLSSNSNQNSLKYSISSSDALIDQINNADDGDTIVIQPGNYTVYGIKIEKNLTICGNGSPDEIFLDGDYQNAIFTINARQLLSTSTILHS